MIKELIPGKLYAPNILLVAYYDKIQKQFALITKKDIFMYIGIEPYQNHFKICIHFHIIFKDKFLYVEKPTLEIFLSQIKLL